MLRRFILGSAGLTLMLGVACAATPDITQATPDQPTVDGLVKSETSPQQVADIDALVEASVMPDGPGVAVLVMLDNQVLYAKGHGLSDIDSQTPITPETQFDLASVSKQMTAIAILKLVEQGQLNVDDPISDYLPEFEDADPDNPVLIRHLLYHTSGLEDYTGGAWEGSDEEFANLTLETHLTWLIDQDPVEEPGVAYEYNNSGYALLALIVQRVSGKPFVSFMQTEIFQPLGMADTLVYSRLGQTIPNQATGYLVDDDQVTLSSSPSVIAGDGNVFSTLNDLARYDIALRQGTIVSTSTLDLAFTPGELDDGTPIEDEGDGYGMGWQITPNYVHHSGSWMGTSTDYRHYLKPQVSIIVLSNDEAFDTTTLTEEIAAVLDL